LKVLNLDITHSIDIDKKIIDEAKKKETLIQVFTSQKKEKVKEKLKTLNSLFPNAHIIGCSTDGEIFEEKLTIKRTIISIAIFEDTKLKSIFINEENSFKDGFYINSLLVNNDTKCVIAFANGITKNGEEFVNGFNSKKKIPLAGGLSANLNKFKECFQIYKDKILEDGVVGVSLNSKNLKVNQGYKLGWEKIGKDHTITSAYKNRVYTIDNKPATDFYEEYLGKEIRDNIPEIGIKFPLIKENFARAVVAQHSDGSLTFAGNLNIGDKVKFGIGDPFKIIESEVSNKEFECEGIFVFSSMARKRFIKNLAKKEIKIFSDNCKTSGFFTYGEFFNDKFYNESLTYLAFCEKECKKIKIEKIYSKPKKYYISPFVIRILKKTAREYEELSKQLLKKERDKFIKTLIDISTILNQGIIIYETNTGRIINYNIIAKNTLKITDNTLNINIFLREPLTEYHQKIFLYDINNNAIKVIANQLTLNGKSLLLFIPIESLEEKEIKSIHQSKLASLGEMLNMIAHQWRQPLHVLSTLGADLELKGMMDNLNSKEIIQIAQKIQSIAHDMSKTINEFLELSKKDEEIKTINLDELLNNIKNLINAQLIHHNIDLIINNKVKTIKTKKITLSHILLNIITNAKNILIERDPKEKKIIINTYKKNNKTIIEIEDTGGGIDSDIINKIFNAYFTTRKNGTGIGLYMSKKLAENINTDIKVINTKKGAKFIIEIDDFSLN